MPRFLIQIAMILSVGFLVEAAPLKPVSVSYEDVIHCFPELASEKISSKVDLDVLKDLIDEKFVNTDSWLQYRKIRFKKDDDQIYILTQLLKKAVPRTYELRLEKWTDKEGRQDLPLPVQAQRIKSLPKQIEQIVAGSEILVDDSAYEASKARGLEMSSVKGLQGVQQLELRDRAQKKSISCNQEKDLGVICTCSKGKKKL